MRRHPSTIDTHHDIATTYGIVKSAIQANCTQPESVLALHDIWQRAEIGFYCERLLRQKEQAAFKASPPLPQFWIGLSFRHRNLRAKAMPLMDSACRSVPTWQVVIRIWVARRRETRAPESATQARSRKWPIRPLFSSQLRAELTNDPSATRSIPPLLHPSTRDPR